MGADQEPGRCETVEGERCGSHHPGRLRQIKEACTDRADHGPFAAVRSDLRKDLAALLRASGPVCRRVCPGVVQADAPRHGPDPALPRSACAEGEADLAGSDPGGESCTDWRPGDRRAEGEYPVVR